MARPTIRAPLAAAAALLALSACTTVPKGLTVSPPDDAVARRVAKIAAKTPARIGLVALHVESGRRLAWNETESFEAASVIKIALLAEAAAEWREARFDPNDRWKLTAKATAAGSGILDEFDPGLMPTNRDLLRIMIALSDNTATNSFIDRFGADAVNRRMAELGLPGIRLVGRIPDADKEPERWSPLGRITPADAAEYFRRLFAGTLVDPPADYFMREIFRTQRTKNRIPRLLLGPKENAWAGKTGSMNGVRGDAGVLTTRKGRFVLVVLADRIPDDDRDGPAVTRAMGELAKAIVDGWSATLPDAPVPPDAKPASTLAIALPRSELTLREARARTDDPLLRRVFREEDRRFWELWERAGGSPDDACLVAMPNSWWEGYGASKIEPVSALVLHHTSQETDEECVALFTRPESQVSSHFLVGRDGRLWQFVSLEHRAWHAGPSLLHGRIALNRSSIGVEITGDGNREPFTPAQIETVVRLVGVLTARYGLQTPWIVGHEHVAPDRKNDPGALFPWNDVLRRSLELAGTLSR
jgi:beta-lactamase class A